MNTIKHFFPIPFVASLFISTLYTGYQWFTTDYSLNWLGAFIAVAPMLGFFTYIMVGSVARVPRHLPFQLSGATIGFAICIVNFETVSFLIALIVGVIGSCLYVFWYTPLDRSSSHISIGKPLPSFTIKDIDGNTINSEQLNNKALWMFIRGNWCPLCVAQVKEMAQQYQDIKDLGADIFMISSQPEKESKKLAKRFDAPMTFLVDKDNKAAKALGIDHIAGVPFGMPGYDIDTALPTVIITDSQGLVVFADQTDDYRIRPEPESFINILKSAP